MALLPPAKTIQKNPCDYKGHTHTHTWGTPLLGYSRTFLFDTLARDILAEHSCATHLRHTFVEDSCATIWRDSLRETFV